MNWRLTSACSHAQDVLVVTAPGSGAETIPFLKTMGQLAHGHWLHCPVRQGAALILIISLTSLCVERTLHSHPGLSVAADLYWHSARSSAFGRTNDGGTAEGSVCSAVGQRAVNRAAFLRMHLSLHRLLRRLRLHHVPPARDSPPYRSAFSLALEVACDFCSAAVIHLVIQ